MERKNIILAEKKELEIFMNPTRQQLLREMERAGVPLTPKFLSDRLEISPSSVQFHIKKLESIGLLELDHTEMIHGITARFYRLSDADVSLGIADGDLTEEKKLLMENSLMNVYRGFRKNVREKRELMKVSEKYGDLMTHTVFLTEQEAREMFDMLQAFISEHKVKSEARDAWELGFVAYRMED